MDLNWDLEVICVAVWQGKVGAVWRLPFAELLWHHEIFRWHSGCYRECGPGERIGSGYRVCLYSQPGVHIPPEVRAKTFRGYVKNKKNNGRKRHICKTRYMSNIVKLIECYDEWVESVTVFNLKKSPVPFALLFWGMVGRPFRVLQMCHSCAHAQRHTRHTLSFCSPPFHEHFECCPKSTGVSIHGHLHQSRAPGSVSEFFSDAST